MIETRYAIHPDAIKNFDTQQLRDAFLIKNIFEDDQVTIVYTHYDRLIIGGVKPISRSISLKSYVFLKADFFLQRREIGIINVGSNGIVSVDGVSYHLDTRDALYIGRGAKEIHFTSTGSAPALFYFNSAPAHAVCPTRKVTLQEAETVELGSAETSNQRVIRKLMVNSVLPTCQLQMGMTELKTGSVWNTMPAHVHDRRMEAYFYFNIPDKQVVCHFMGQPQETRHIFINNNEAVISPPWSIHSGAGTSNYSFIWGMAGENLDYSDMDPVSPGELR
ncbi:5-dehydro-4-deoxy-D-glucuronate isomerase [Chryseolinea sp. H1M3-3]|uniref:5-dehydro-4-deoxy-D-glucuronate isomerase n=1 Tax=Chryseolinea sp. H1M3-3 TaxID=3034144 RepID=UPI0023ED562A|nr:5-dehydro-4-deoxy-D-glucuronate isomerase [Chryseolinea sp. H1M3-3]